MIRRRCCERFLLLIAPGLAQAAPASVYLALGDSLGGVQPLPNLVETRQGFVDDRTARPPRTRYFRTPISHALVRHRPCGPAADRATTLRSLTIANSISARFHSVAQGRAHHDLDRRRRRPALHQRGRRHRRHVPGKGKTATPSFRRRGAPPRRGIVRADRWERLLPRGVGAAAAAGWPMLAQKSLDITPGLNFCSAFTPGGAKAADVAGAFASRTGRTCVINIPRNA